MNMTYAEAMTEVHARVKAAATSFAAGMRLLPAPRREAMYALYAFCREVDDIADDSPTAESRAHGLALWKQRLHVLFRDRTGEEAISVALAPAIERFGLIETDFQAIVEGMEMDAAAPILAPDMADLDRYCDHVASAVGRVSVRIFGDSSADAMRVAHHLGRALQMTNILRDLAEDAARGRLYLPREALEAANIATRDPALVLKDPALPVACRFLAAQALRHFEDADKAMRKCQWHAMRPARAMRNYYKAIYDRLIKEDWKDPARRVSLPVLQKILIALRGLVE